MEVKKSILAFLLCILTIQMIPFEWANMLCQEEFKNEEIEEMLTLGGSDEEDASEKNEAKNTSKILIDLYTYRFEQYLELGQHSFSHVAFFHPMAYHGEILIPPPNQVV